MPLNIRPCSHRNYHYTIWIPKEQRRPDDPRQKFFVTKDDAVAFCQERDHLWYAMGQDICQITNEQWQQARALISMLPPNTNLVEVGKLYLKHAGAPATHTGKVLGLAHKFMESREVLVARGSLKRKTFTADGSDFRPFLEKFGEGTLKEAGDGVVVWLQQVKLSAQSVIDYASIIKQFFVFAGWKDHPLIDWKKPQVRRSDPGVLTPDQMRLLLAYAKREEIPPLVLGGFAGIRPSEILRLEWAQVDFEENEIRINNHVAKSKAGTGSIKLQPNLALWLAPYAKMSGRVAWKYPDEFSWIKARKKLISRVTEDFEVNKVSWKMEWPADGLRHSFASYHLRHFSDRGRLIEDLRHQDGAMLIEHYRNVSVSKAAAADWWEIKP